MVSYASCLHCIILSALWGNGLPCGIVMEIGLICIGNHVCVSAVIQENPLGRTCSAVGQNRFKVHFCLFRCCGFLRRLNKKAGDLGSKNQLPNSPLWMTGLRVRSAHTPRSYWECQRLFRFVSRSLCVFVCAHFCGPTQVHDGFAQTCILILFVFLRLFCWQLLCLCMNCVFLAVPSNLRCSDLGYHLKWQTGRGRPQRDIPSH